MLRPLTELSSVATKEVITFASNPDRRTVRRAVSKQRGKVGEVAAVHQANNVSSEFGRHKVLLGHVTMRCTKNQTARICVYAIQDKLALSFSLRCGPPAFADSALETGLSVQGTPLHAERICSHSGSALNEIPFFDCWAKRWRVANLPLLHARTGVRRWVIDRKTHPRMDATLVLNKPFVVLDNRGTRSRRNENVIVTRWLGNQIPVHDLGTFRCGDRITRSCIKECDKPATKLLYFGKSVSFAA